MNLKQKKKVLAVLDSNYFCVVATNSISGFAPEAAIVAFSYTENLNLVFASYNSSRKNANIKKVPEVSIVVGWDHETNTTVQLEGRAFLLSDSSELRKYQKIHCSRHPGSQKYLENPEEEYFKVEPYWIRYSNLNQKSYEILEFSI